MWKDPFPEVCIFHRRIVDSFLIAVSSHVLYEALENEEGGTYIESYDLVGRIRWTIRGHVEARLVQLSLLLALAMLARQQTTDSDAFQRVLIELLPSGMYALTRKIWGHSWRSTWSHVWSYKPERHRGADCVR